MDDATNQMIGIILIGVGVLDPVLGILVVGPRIPDPAKRRIIVTALIASGLGMMGIGAAFLLGLFS